MRMMTGLCANQHIEAMIANGHILAEPQIDPSQIQPASLDLRLGTIAYRMRTSALTGANATVKEALSDFIMHTVDLSAGAVLERGCVYLIPLVERLALPATVTGVANAKSSSGRLDLLTRTIVDYGTEFDRIPAGYSGAVYVEVCPRSFSILVRPGLQLNQLRFRNGQSQLSDAELRKLHASETLVSGEAIIEDGLGFAVDLSATESKLIGYRAKPHTGVIDLDQLDYYEPAEYWEALYCTDDYLILDPEAFYILVSKEAVHIPPDFAAEMAPYLAMVGEFRVHYAGFFDPGFGHDLAGGRGSRAVLEVRCREVPFVLNHGQIVGRLLYERLAERPTLLYGRDLGSNYQGQGLKLSKQFKRPL